MEVYLKESPNSSRGIISNPPENSPLRADEGLAMESTKAFGTKRQQPDCPSSPSNQELTGSKGANRLVYVRRKLETVHIKMSTCDNVDSASSSRLSKITSGETGEPNAQKDQTAQEPNVLSHSNGKPIIGFEQNTSAGTAAAPVPAPAPPISQRLSTQERIHQLRKFLHHRDQLTHDDYKRMLRTLSETQRRELSVELVQRADHLFKEEERELHRMRGLNIKGYEAALQDHALFSNQVTSIQAQLQRNERTMCNVKLPFLRNNG